MRRKDIECRDCGTTEHIILGFVPSRIIQDTISNDWFNAAVCTSCGGITPVEPTWTQLERAEERYIGVLEMEGIISSQEAKNILG